VPQVLAPGGGELTHSVSSDPTRVEGHGRARGSQAGCALCLAIQWPTPPVQVVETPCECRDKASSCGGVVGAPSTVQPKMCRPRAWRC